MEAKVAIREKASMLKLQALVRENSKILLRIKLVSCMVKQDDHTVEVNLANEKIYCCE